MTLDKTTRSTDAHGGNWTESWRLSFEVDGLMKESLADLMSEVGKRSVGRYGLFLYSEHTVLIHKLGDETTNEIDPRDQAVADQLEAFSIYVSGLREVGFGRLIDLRNERTGIMVRTAAHLGGIATSTIRRDEAMGAGRGFLSGPSVPLRLAIPAAVVAGGANIRLTESRRALNESFYGNPAGGVANESERIRSIDSSIEPGILVKHKINNAA